MMPGVGTLGGPLGDERKRVWQRVVLIAAVGGQLFLAGDWYAFAAVVPFVAKELTLTATEVGLVQGAFAATYAIGMLIWSPLSRSVAARHLFAIGLLGSGAAMVLQSAAGSFPVLIGARFLIGFFDAAVWLGTMKLIIMWFAPSERGSKMALLLAAFSLAITLDFAVGIPMAQSLGWRYFFALLAGVTIAVGFGGFALRDNPEQTGQPALADGSPRSLGEVFKARYIYISGFAIFGATFALSATATWAVPGFIAVQGMPAENGAPIGMVMGLSQVLALVGGGYLTDRIGERSIMIRIGSFLCAVAAAAFALAMSVPGLAMPSLLAVTALGGLSVFSGGAIFSFLAERYPPALATESIGYAEVFGILATFAAPAMMGIIIDATSSFVAAFAAFAIVECLVFLLLIAMCWKKMPAPPKS